MPVSRDCVKCHEPIPIEDQTAWDSEIPIYCPCCGEGAPRRDGGSRVKMVSNVYIAHDGSRREAVTIDVSKTGMKVFYLGAPLPVDSEVKLDVEMMALYGQPAEVVWSHKAASTYSHSGLRLK